MSSASSAWYDSPEVRSVDATGTYYRCKSDITVLPFEPVDPASPKPEGHVRIVCISDTHSQYLVVPDGDVLVHCGDWTKTGEPKQIEAFTSWFGSLPHPHKVCIAGNHDVSMHEEFYAENWSRFHRLRCEPADVRAKVLADTRFTYLEDSSVEIMGLKFYGSPWQPEFCNWAFNLDRGEPCAAKWRAIPEDTDVLLTHGPALAHGDLCLPGELRAGCVDLLVEIERRIKPQ